MNNRGESQDRSTGGKCALIHSEGLGGCALRFFSPWLVSPWRGAPPRSRSGGARRTAPEGRSRTPSRFRSLFDNGVRFGPANVSDGEQPRRTAGLRVPCCSARGRRASHGQAHILRATANTGDGCAWVVARLTVVHVPVQDHNPPNPLARKRSLRRNGAVIVKAKSHCSLALRVVARRPHDGKGPREPARGDGGGGFGGAARREARGGRCVLREEEVASRLRGLLVGLGDVEHVLLCVCVRYGARGKGAV